MKTTVYEIPSDYLSTVETELARINRRAERLGLPAVNVTTIASFTKKKNNSFGIAIPVEYSAVAVEGDLIVLNGWTLLGTMDNDGLAIAKAIPGEEIPEDLATVDNAARCDHCNRTDRRRNKVVFVKNDETGEVKTVGTTCVGDYLGADKNDINHVVKVLGWLSGLATIGDSDEGFESGGRFRHVEMISVETVSRYTAAVLTYRPWISRAVARDRDCPATADELHEILFPPRFSGREGQALQAEWEAKRDRLLDAISDDTNETATAAIEHVAGFAGASEYERNLVKLVSVEPSDDGLRYVPAKYLAFLASVVPSYLRQVEKLKKRAARPVSEFVGEVGKRSEFEVVLDSVRWFDSDWGESGLVRFYDRAGNLLIWWTGGARALSEMNDGGTYRIAGTVKKHEDYRGTKQTALTRVALRGAIDNWTTEADEGSYRPESRAS